MEALGTQSKVLCRIRGFDPGAFFPAGDALLSEDRFVQFGVASGMLAVQDAGLAREEHSPSDIAGHDPAQVGCIMSTAIGGTPTVAATWRKLTDRGTHPLRYEPVGPTFAHATCSNYPGAVLMRKYGFQGPSVALSTGCTAGMDALGLSFEMLATGDPQ